MSNTDSKKKILFILNPKAGSGLNAKIALLINKQINHDLYEAEITYTDYAGHGVLLSKTAVDKKYFAVIAVGGDGTINEIAQSLKQTETALGIIPTGSGNGFARHLNIPVHFNKAIQILNSGNVISCDTFTVNNQFAFNIAGIGFDAYVADQFSRSNSRGFKTYFKIVVKEYFSYKNKNISLLIDGKKAEHEMFITSFANSSQWGNNARIAPLADIQDGILNVSIIKKMPFAKLIPVIKNMFNGKLTPGEYVHFYKGKEIEINCNDEINLHIDGEAKGKVKQLSIKIIPTSLKVIVP